MYFISTGAHVKIIATVRERFIPAFIYYIRFSFGQKFTFTLLVFGGVAFSLLEFE